MRIHRLLLLASAALLLASACAEERPAIDRVQPDALPKTFFVGADLHDTADDPEFYSQGTLVDVGYGAAQDGLFTSTYGQPLSRIKWVIQEDLLVARLTYERISGSDGKGAGAASDDGIVVAAYPIKSHFDIQRDYNPSTGEQLNTMGENTSDRPWYERAYIRVDWSSNLSTANYDFDTLAQTGIYGGVTYEPLSYTVTDPYHPDAPHFVIDDGYFDITNKAFATPQMIDLSYLGWGIDQFPACWLDADFSGGGAPSAGCSAVELTIRQSFRRVTDTDYEPDDWDGREFQAYGAFTAERYGYARNYGMTDTNWHRFIARYNLWERSHFYTKPASMEGAIECYTPATTPAGSDPHRDVDPADGTEDECAGAGEGSRCDEFKQRCTLPFRERTPVAQVWFYTSGGDTNYFAPTGDATHEWDVALRSAVMSARYTECMRTGHTDCGARWPVTQGQQDDNWDAVGLAREIDDCRNGIAYAGQDCDALAQTIGDKRGATEAVIALAKMPELIVLCHSPVEAADPAECGSPRLPVGTTMAMCNEAEKSRDASLLATCRKAKQARRGDLRYHQVNAIGTPQTPSPWGIMTDATDPLTGEKVSASINIWTHVNDLFAQGVVDTSRYIAGELTTQDVTDGTYVKAWADAAAAATAKGAVGPMSRDDRDGRLAAFGGIDVAKLRAARDERTQIDPVAMKQFASLKKQVEGIRADGNAATTSRGTYDARRRHAAGSPLEAELTTHMMQEFAGVADMGDSPELTALASPLRGANPAMLRDLQKRREIALADRGACIRNEAPAPFAMANLSKVLQRKFGDFSAQDGMGTQLERGARMQKYLAQRAHYAVIIHEMGHSIALRHNFVSSSDALGFRPQYWQLRTDDGEITEECTDFRADGSCVGPRYFDPTTPNERDNLIWMFMQSSVMDYAGEATQDLMGLGAYDFAATRMFYGGSVAVQADESFALGTPRGLGMLNKLDDFGGILGITPKLGVVPADPADPLATRDYHYSAMQNELSLIQNCTEIDPQDFKPASWDEEQLGTWDPLLDGLIVTVRGKTTKCRQQPVDFVSWSELRSPTAADVSFPRSYNGIDAAGRIRVPYGFATDGWADTGNLSVFRHDNGADPYELFDFLITTQEVGHIFDNYRRNRQTFSVRSASTRALGRYNEKLRDSAKGLGLLRNIYKDFALASGYDFDTFWPVLAPQFFPENILASEIAFDHFSRQLQRPEAGPHFAVSRGFLGTEPVLRSSEDTIANAGETIVTIPNGATGFYGNVGFGGRPLENRLAEDRGEYDSSFTMNAGSYYEKAWTSMLMTESVDNFVSSSRTDFLDSRYRAVSLADLFPEGYRRWLGSNLTGDDELKGPRVATDNRGNPVLDNEGYPAEGLGWTSYWRPDGAVSCFPTDGSLLCGPPPADSRVLDPQVGWEQQKFLIAWTLMYLPENDQQWWLDQLYVWELGVDTDPGFEDRIELHGPTGKTYIARTFGKEMLLGRSVEKAPAARVLEYANSLLKDAYVVSDGPDRDGDGTPDWYLPVMHADDGLPTVKYDPSIKVITAGGGISNNGRPGCNATDSSDCTCASNRACVALSQYLEVPYFMRQAMAAYGLAHPSMKGIY